MSQNCLSKKAPGSIKDVIFCNSLTVWKVDLALKFMFLTLEIKNLRTKLGQSHVFYASLTAISSFAKIYRPVPIFLIYFLNDVDVKLILEFINGFR